MEIDFYQRWKRFVENSDTKQEPTWPTQNTVLILMIANHHRLLEWTKQALERGHNEGSSPGSEVDRDLGGISDAVLDLKGDL